jgi:Tol biopolymer transport system component
VYLRHHIREDTIIPIRFTAVVLGASAPLACAGVLSAAVESSSSPGGRIAFSSGSQSSSDVYVANPDGSGVRRLTNGRAHEFDPSWSPDGRKIAYRRETATGAPDIYVMNADGSEKRNITKGAASQGISPRWSPDGRKIAFASIRGRRSFTQLWTMNADGTHQRRLSGVNGEYPDWSPDGRKLAFDHMVSSNDWDIWLVNADGSGAKPVVAWRGSKEQGAAWSPDGEWIAFQSTRGSDDGLPHIWVTRADGSAGRQLTNAVGERPVWSPDGSQVLFTAGGLYVTHRDGGSAHLIRVDVGGEKSLADWARSR